MNHRLKLRTLIPIVAVALGFEIAAAKEISVERLPAPAKRVVDTEVGSGKLKKVEEVQHNGETIYALTYLRPDGTPKYIYLRANGDYVRDQNDPNATTTTPKATPTARQQVQLNKMPQAVQRTIQTETRNGPVSRIEQMANNGSVIYAVFFRQANGQEKTIYLNPDGSYVPSGKVNSATPAPKAPGHSWDALGTRSTTTPSNQR